MHLKNKPPGDLRQTALINFTLDKMVEQTIAVYNHLVFL